MLRRVSAGSQTTRLPSISRNVSYFRRPSLRLNSPIVRWAGLTSLGLFTLGLTTFVAIRCKHIWIERIELGQEDDEETRRWQWHLEMPTWSGTSGTDPALGYKGRDLLRNALTSYKTAMQKETDTQTVISHLINADNLLRQVIAIAESKAVADKLHPQTLFCLIGTQASILERLGNQALLDCRTQYERVWISMNGKGIGAARMAVKLGDLSNRLGWGDQALRWWSLAIQELTRSDSQTSAVVTDGVLIPEVPPSSPLAQRTLTSALVSLSAFCAASGQLRLAQSIEERALSLLRSIDYPESLTSASPPQTLHSLSILHRSAVLYVHLAEVLHAQHRPLQNTIEQLQAAANSSERVAYALVGSPLTRPSGMPPPLDKPLPAYTKSLSMNVPAHALLRDAHRTAAEAWNLMGELLEKADDEVACGCYERALRWAGNFTPGGSESDIGQPGEGTLTADWDLFLRNYTRTRRVLSNDRKNMST